MALRVIIVILFLSVQTTGFAQKITHQTIWENNQAKSVKIILPDNIFSEKRILSFRRSGAFTNIFGKLETSKNEIIFTPIIPFTHNVLYEAYASDEVLISFKPVNPTVAPQVKAVYPLTNVLPENFLKFYVEFDQPMGEGKAYDNIHLYLNDKEVENAFVPLQPELWNEDQTILTLWVDPGRIKRDLGPNKYYGPVLEEGNKYKLTIDEELISKAGKKLKNSTEKIFNVSSRDEEKPNAKAWKVITPKMGSRDELQIEFNEPLDYQVIINALRVILNNQLIEGVYRLENDRKISFIPTHSWLAREYGIEIESRVEDLAGNNLNRLFDVDLEKKEALNTEEYAYLDFVIE